MKIRMQALGLHTIGDLANASIHAVHKEFGINGVVLRRIARGEEKGSISEHIEHVEKSFNHNHTLSNAIHNRNDALDEIKRMTEYICRRMRAKDLITDHLALSVRYQDLGYSGGKQRLHQPTNSEKELYHRALEIFETLPEPNYNHKIRAFGISVYDLHKVSGYNLNFFDRDHLIPYKQIDMLKDKYGENIIRMGIDAS
jgi:nucleotidyltransferase/DNA polymerase involved in DNA repair